MEMSGCSRRQRDIRVSVSASLSNLTHGRVVVGQSFSQLTSSQEFTAHLQVVLDLSLSGPQDPWNIKRCWKYMEKWHSSRTHLVQSVWHDFLKTTCWTELKMCHERPKKPKTNQTARDTKMELESLWRACSLVTKSWINAVITLK